MDRQALGHAGERLAAAHLESKGYEILDRNVYTAQGELDLVARSPDGVIVFVEVRTRRGAYAAEQAAASVDERKQRRLHELAGAYLAERAPGANAPIDIITVAVGADGHVSNLTHYETPSRVHSGSETSSIPLCRIARWPTIMGRGAAP